MKNDKKLSPKLKLKFEDITEDLPELDFEPKFKKSKTNKIKINIKNKRKDTSINSKLF